MHLNQQDPHRSPEQTPPEDQVSPVVLFVRMARPLFLLGGILLYALGSGIARYLGNTIDWGDYLIGQAWVTLLQLSAQFLDEYYDAPEDQTNRNRTPFTGGSGSLGPGKLPRRVALQSALGVLAVLASLTVLMLAQGMLTPAAVMIMALAFLGAFFYSAPPVRLEETGYGELVASVLVAFLVPAYAFLLQTGELHRLIPMTAFPLTTLHLAMLLAFNLPDYANDLRHERFTLLVRLGWERGMLLHNLLILSAYLLLALAVTFGLPFGIAWPAFLTLPLGLLQIWQMRRIAQGASPNWTALTLNAVTLFVATVYLIAFGFWTS